MLLPRSVPSREAAEKQKSQSRDRRRGNSLTFWIVFRFTRTGAGSMTKFVASAKKFIKSEDAPTMVEYGLLVALIAIVVAVAAKTLGTSVSTLFNTVAGSV
jgi:pilus assembly protein Flp/PilA